MSTTNFSQLRAPLPLMGPMGGKGKGQPLLRLDIFPSGWDNNASPMIFSMGAMPQAKSTESNNIGKN